MAGGVRSDREATVGTGSTVRSQRAAAAASAAATKAMVAATASSSSSSSDSSGDRGDDEADEAKTSAVAASSGNDHKSKSNDSAATAATPKPAAASVVATATLPKGAIAAAATPSPPVKPEANPRTRARRAQQLPKEEEDNHVDNDDVSADKGAPKMVGNSGSDRQLRSHIRAGQRGDDGEDEDKKAPASVKKPRARKAPPSPSKGDAAAPGTNKAAKPKSKSSGHDINDKRQACPSPPLVIKAPPLSTGAKALHELNTIIDMQTAFTVWIALPNCLNEKELMKEDDEIVAIFERVSHLLYAEKVRNMNQA